MTTMQRIVLAFLLFVSSMLRVGAQEQPLVPSDSLAPLPEQPPLPALRELPGFELQVRPDTLLVVVEAYKDEPAFRAEFLIGGQSQELLFERGIAAVPHAFSYKGELLKVQTLRTSGKSKEHITRLVHLRKTSQTTVRQQSIPLWWSIIPPLVAIILALLTRQVVLSLFMGIMAGSWLTAGMPLNPGDLMKTFFRVLDTYILNALNSSSHLSVLLFSMLIGGMVALISRNGGMVGIVQKLAPLARGPLSTQLVTWFMGIAIFFDDYANSLIVGNTMRPLTDKFRISREKLAYIVDSTAAPVASIAFITTWIGAELGYISDAVPALEGLENPPGAYSIFLQSLGYAFYSYFTLIFILLIIFTGRDFGAMLRAERRARETGAVYALEGGEAESEDMEELEPVPGAPRRWLNGLLPVLVVVFGTLMGLIDTGMESSFNQLSDKGIVLPDNSWGGTWSNLHYLNASESELWQAIDKTSAADLYTAFAGELAPAGSEEEQRAALRELSPYRIWALRPDLVPLEPAGSVRKMGILIGNADSYSALLWASLSAVLLALLLTVVQRIMRLDKAIGTTIKGFKTMMPALMILVLAWSLATTTEELSTAEFLTSALGEWISPYVMPLIVFVLSAVISFSTGSSWSTMAILYPIAIPMTWSICMAAGMSQDQAMPILYNVIATVLSASVWGDHCSPISDTTILSSLASGCNHIAHVRTQMPYALLVGLVSLLINYLATILGLPFVVNILLGTALLAAWLLLFGRKPLIINH